VILDIDDISDGGIPDEEISRIDTTVADDCESSHSTSEYSLVQDLLKTRLVLFEDDAFWCDVPPSREHEDGRDPPAPTRNYAKTLGDVDAKASQSVRPSQVRVPTRA
jgi:hypothetical protein